MQRVIDTYFKKVPKKSDEPATPQPKKRKAPVISSDEDEVAPSPQVQPSREHKKTRIDKTSPRDAAPAKKTSLTSKLGKQLKTVNPAELFAAEPVRVEAKKAPKPKDKATLELDDNDFNQSLLELDVSQAESKASKETNKKVAEEQRESRKTEEKRGSKRSEEKHEPKKSEEKRESKKVEEKREQKKSEEKRESKKVEEKRESRKADDVKKESVKEENLSPPSPKKVKTERRTMEIPALRLTPKVEKKPRTSTPRPKKEPTDLDGSVLSDEDRHERKRMTAILYQKYKNRSSCLNPGSKEVPKGKPNCLAGLSFLVTGVLESMERDEAGSIIKEFGGKVMGTVGKRLNYMIVGEEAGPKKLVMAEEYGVKILSEDGFFDLIREKSGMAVAKNGKEEKPTTSPKNKNLKQEVKKEKDVKKEEDVKKAKHEARKDEAEQVRVKKEKVRTPEKNGKTSAKPSPEQELNNNGEHRAKVKQEPTKSSSSSTSPHDEVQRAVKAPVSDDVLAWVDKYRPKTVKEIIGQQGVGSNVTKLTNWLSKWYINHDGKKKHQRPNPWAKNDDGSFYKAALLSGPPGIGKTTTATLVCKELGFDVVEFNASDTRSKRLLKEEVAELLSNQSLYGYFHGSAQAMTKKHVLIMDEVDGMAGNEDRGGIQELIGLIKESSVPIVCMCNDRNHQKMRSLVNYCYDLRFNRPRIEQIKAAVLSICFKEKFKMESSKIEEIIAATNNDIRQSINHISLLSAGKELQLKGDGERTAQKDMKIGPWDVVRKVFSFEEHKRMTLNDKSDLFFHDYSLAPLFVQQNYLQVSPVGSKSELMQNIARTADALSLGDMVDRRIRSQMAWSLLPTQAFFSSVMPGEYMCGNFTGQINFPGWLGKNSRATKRSRLSQEIHDHTRVRTSGSRLSIRLDYAPFLLASIVRPLRDSGMEGVAEAVNVLREYHLLREDLDSLIELTSWPGKKGLMDGVDGRVKAALTRTYNKEVLAYSYSAMVGIKKKKAEVASEDADLLIMEGDEAIVVESDDDKDDLLENDGLIKAKKKSSAASTAAKPKATTSKKAASNGAGTSKPKATNSRAKK